jgi:hypothetical protein
MCGPISPANIFLRLGDFHCAPVIKGVEGYQPELSFSTPRDGSLRVATKTTAGVLQQGAGDDQHTDYGEEDP